MSGQVLPLVPESEPREEDQTTRLIARLREAQSAAGTASAVVAKLYRLDPPDPKHPSGKWLRSYNPDVAWFDGLEEAIATEWGGGKFKLVVEVRTGGGKPQYFNLGISIDPEQYPPKIGATPAPAPPALSAESLEQMISAAVARAVEQLKPASVPPPQSQPQVTPAPASIDLATLLRLQDKHHEAELALVKAQVTQAAPTASGGGDLADSLKKVVEVRKLLDEVAPGTSGQRSPAAVFGERVAEKFLDRLGQRAVDAIGKYLETHGPEGAPATPPTSAPATTSQVTCPACKKLVASGKFCTECGNALTAATPAATPAAPKPKIQLSAKAIERIKQSGALPK